MNILSRWDPLQELEEVQNRLSGVLGHHFPRGMDGESEAMRIAEWSPRIDITEDEKEYLIKADLPEVKKDELKVTVENGVLMISGERKFEKEEKGKKYHRMERAYGNFMRTFDLPDDATPNKVNAEFKDGVLKIHLAKSETTRPKEIDIKIS